MTTTDADKSALQGDVGVGTPLATAIRDADTGQRGAHTKDAF